MKKGNAIALLPIGVFLCIYLGLGILFEYVMKIPMGFYNVPIIIAFLAAILVACLQNRKVSFDEKLEIMAQGLADKNIITMLLIFLTAGASPPGDLRAVVDDNRLSPRRRSLQRRMLSHPPPHTHTEPAHTCNR